MYMNMNTSHIARIQVRMETAEYILIHVHSMHCSRNWG